MDLKRTCLSIIFLVIFFHSLRSHAQNTDSTIRVFETRLTKAKADTTKIQLLLQLSDFCSNQSFEYQQRALHSDLQALALSKELNLPAWQNNCLLKTAIQYAILKNFAASRQCYNQVIKYWQEKGDLKKLFSIYQQLQVGFRYGQNRNLVMLKEALLCIQKDKEIALKLGDRLNAILCLKDDADVQLNLGRLSIAESELLEVANRLKAIHYPDLRNTYNLLSAVYHLKGNLNKQLFYLVAAVKEAETVKDTHLLMALYNKLGWAYEDLGIYDKSIFYYSKLISNTNGGIYKNNKDCFGFFGRICSVMIKQHKPLQALHFIQHKESIITPATDVERYYLYWDLASCYFALKRNDLAEHYYLKMINMPAHDWGAVGINYNVTLMENKEVCKFYIATNNYVKAAYYLKRALALPDFNVSALGRSEMQHLQFKVDSAFGNYVSAIKHFETSKRMTDSIFNVKESNDVADIQAKYETERKDKDILLLKKQSVIDQGRFEKRRMIGNFLIAGVILLLFLLGVLYSRYLLRQRNITLLQDKQKEISGKNQVLEKLLHENEWLLKEVHHRVKNNLQIITGLLHSQSRYLKDKTALNAVLDSQHRVNAMSLIHQKLYKSPNVKSIYMPEYIGELVDYLKESFKTGLRIVFRLDISPVMLDAIYAVPVGLILNEIITNALKYAFPFGDDDTIRIKLTHSENGDIELKVSDNGRGMPEGFDASQNNSFGMILIQGLIEDVYGSFLLESANGTHITVHFNILKKNENIIGTEL